MNPLVLTKISKYAFIGSVSAFVSFAASFNSNAQLIYACVLGGTIFCGSIAVLWEGRESISAQPTEEGLNSLLTSITTSAKKKEYLLKPSTRLEIVIALIVATIATLIGAL
jgi:hypothetical protein